MSAADALILSLCGRLACGAFFAFGLWHLVYPPPTSASRGMEAAFICMAGIVLLTMTGVLSFLLKMLYTTETPRDASKVVDVIFKALAAAKRIVTPGSKP